MAKFLKGWLFEPLERSLRSREMADRVDSRAQAACGDGRTGL